jgi:hypothetical protein
MADQDHPQMMATERNLERANGLINIEWELLNRGETHYVSHAITAAVDAAAREATDEPLFPTDLPCPHGLMVFEYPLIIPDLHPITGAVMRELQMPIRAIGWSTQTVQVRNRDTDMLDPHPGIFYALYTDEGAWRSLFLPSVKEHLPEEWAEYRHVYDGVSTHDPMWAIDTSGWAFGTSWERGGGELPREAFEQGKIHDDVAHVRRFILAMWRFQWSRILVPQIHKPTRAEHRQAVRAGLKLEDGYIKVLRLRRHVEMEARGEPTPTGDQLAYDHQWMVRGHPRRQWFPSLGPARNPDGSFNVDSHRLVWIEPHTKGNPYARLVVGHSVTAVVR